MQEAPLDSPSVLKVLVIGPDSLSGELAATVLGRPDVDRVHVAAAAETLDVAERLRPHMVVIDLPPSEAGVLAGQLRENDATRPTAIVVLSRSARPDAETELRKAGVNVVVPVPIDPFLWDRRLEELLSVPARRGHRIPVRLRDWSRFVSDADEDEGTVINIGARGVLLETARQLELGTKVGLSFNLPDDPVPVALVGQVVRMAGEERGLVRVGVEFLVYRADARERIAAFVEAEPRPERPGAPSLALTVRSFGEAREWEDELRASEIRKALILDSALDCILTADHEGRIIEFNSAARRLFGYSRSEVLGREVADTIVPPGLRDEMRRRLREFVVSGDSPDLGRRREATAMRSDGTLVPVEVVVVPAYVKGRVILSAYIRDLSERRRSERLAVARQRATQALTASLSLVEAAPTVLDALVHGLQCNEARLWVVDLDSRAPSLAGTSSGAPHPEASGARDVLARQCLEEGIAVWEGPPAMGTGVGLAVPVRAGGSVLGVLEVRCEKAREREIDWVTALADVASLLALFLKRQRAEADLQRFARYDSLTGLPNRSFFLDTLERTLSRAGRQRTRSALLVPRPRRLQGRERRPRARRRRQRAADDGRAPARRHPQLRPGGPHRRRRVHRAGVEPGARRRRRARRARPARPAGEALPHRQPRRHAQRQRGHQRLPRGRHRRRHAAAQRRPRDVPLQAGRQEHLPLLHGRDERARARAHAAARQPEERAGARRVRDRLPAGGLQGPRALARGALALAPPQARARGPVVVHRARRGKRPDAPDRRGRAARRHALRGLARAARRHGGRQPHRAPVLCSRTSSSWCAARSRPARSRRRGSSWT